VASNTRGVHFTVQRLLNAQASVILMSSVSGTAGLPGLGVCSAAKAAIRSLAADLASWARRNVLP
jgi:NAD(P)-dependent dehydrogenase (short-subunit alcohol dehydrogenase family)